MKKAKLLQGLRSIFPQFRDKSSIIQYYCNYDVPKKQTHLLKFWSEVLKFINSYFATLLLSQKELTELLEVYGLKPLPIKKILKQLHQNKIVYSISDLHKVYGKSKGMETQSPSKGFFGNVIGYFYQSSKPQVELDDMVFFKQIIDQKLMESYLPLRQIFSNTSIHEEEFVLKKLRDGICLLSDASLILDILQLQHKIARVQYSTSTKIYRLVIYSGDGIQINSNLVQLQKVKFGLKIRLAQINTKIQITYPKVHQLGEKAKECLQKGDKNMSKNFLKQKILQQKYIAGLIDRRQIINNNLHQLQQNEMNQNILPIIRESQDLVRETAIDINTLTDIKLNNDEIKYNLEQADQIYKEVADHGLQQEEDELYRQLEKQMMQEGTKQSAMTSAQNKGNLNNIPFQATFRNSPFYTAPMQKRMELQ